MIKYSNGSKDVFKKEEDQKMKTAGLGVAGFVIGLASIPIWALITIIIGYIAGPLSVIFGSISLGKIARNPDKYRGKGLAITSIIIGALSIIATTVILLLRLGVFK